jgi:hypothetical protein
VKLHFSPIEYTVESLLTFDPARELSEDLVVRSLQLAASHSSKRFVAKLFVEQGHARRLVWEVETDDATSIKSAIRNDMQVQAESLGVDFVGLVDALMRELHLTEEGALLLGLAFTFPLTLAGARLRIMGEASTGKRGAPIRVDDMTGALSRLRAAWLCVTGRVPGTAERALFVRALDAAQPFLPPLRTRSEGKEIRQIRKVIRTETKKLDSGDVIFVAPLNPLADLATPQDPNRFT